MTRGRTRFWTRCRSRSSYRLKAPLLKKEFQRGEALSRLLLMFASALGLETEQISTSPGVLSDAGLIRYSDGEITVLDRGGGEKRSCECYAVVRKKSAQLLA